MELDQQQPRRRVISVFTLVMINVIAIDSLRNVPAAAEYGFSLLFLYALAAIGFFIPSALVSAELASSWPKTGGIYVWVREAFGRHWGFFAIWLQWIENVIWYPTMMSFIAATILYVFDPNLVHNKIMLLLLMISFFWLATFLNMLGMKISGFISILTAIFGTLLPMTFIILLGSLWLYWDKPIFIHFDWQHFFPGLNDVKQLSYLAGILLSLFGR